MRHFLISNANFGMKVRYSTILLCLFWFSVLPAQAQKWKDEAVKQQQELENIRKELESKRKRIAELRDKEGTALAQLRNIEEELELIEELTERIDQRSRNVKVELGKEIQRLDSIGVSLNQRRALLSVRIRGIYKFYRFQRYEALLGSSSLADFFKRLKFLQLVAQEDYRLIHEFLKEKEKLERSKKTLEGKRNELEALGREKRKEEENKLGDKERRQRVLNKIKSEKKLYLQTATELEESAKKIEDFLIGYERERKKVESERDLFVVLKGRLKWPVEGKVVSAFGEQKHPVFKTVTFNQGIDLQAERGAEVRAIADGKVIYSSWLRGRGKFLILQHEYGYYTIYADLGEVLVEEGEEVGEGQFIARVGESALFSNWGLHFELRKGRTQLDPLEWLKQ